MRPIAERTGRPLEWTQPHAFQNDYELRDGDELVATLRWKKRFGTLAVAEAGGETWTFKRIGFLRPRITVRRADAEADLALFEPGWWANGVLTLDRGRRLLWRHQDFWHHEWAFLTESEFPVVTFKSTLRLVRSGATLEIAAGPGNPEDLPLLACLGWYLMVLTAHDAAAVAASSGGAS